jgi:HSP20 family molecular chaperone IbpA
VGSLCRSFDITGVQAEKISARFENGLLTVTLPKAEIAKNTQRELTIETDRQS